jgi:hypothetical protein
MRYFSGTMWTRKKSLSYFNEGGDDVMDRRKVLDAALRQGGRSGRAGIRGRHPPEWVVDFPRMLHLYQKLADMRPGKIFNILSPSQKGFNILACILDFFRAQLLMKDLFPIPFIHKCTLPSSLRQSVIQHLEIRSGPVAIRQIPDQIVNITAFQILPL